MVTVKYGDRGPMVRLAQDRLNAYGARLIVDGRFGAQTQEATKKFQSLHHLAADGIIGPLTWRSLLLPVVVANRKPKPPAHVPTPTPQPLPAGSGIAAGSIQIDVSNNDGVIDWSKVRADKHNIKSVYAKVSEGAHYVDMYWRQNKNGCIGNHLYVGGYHFAHADTVAGGVAQIDFFLSLLGQSHNMLRACIDWEDKGCGDPSQVPTLEAMVSRVHEKLGHWPVIYGGYYLLHAMNIPADSVIHNCPLWIAAYPNVVGVPQPWKTYWSHQYTSSEQVEGVNGKVDMSKVFVPLDSLIV
jgi:lysozyme